MFVHMEHFDLSNNVSISIHSCPNYKFHSIVISNQCQSVHELSLLMHMSFAFKPVKVPDWKSGYLQFAGLPSTEDFADNL